MTKAELLSKIDALEREVSLLRQRIAYLKAQGAVLPVAKPTGNVFEKYLPSCSVIATPLRSGPLVGERGYGYNPPPDPWVGPPERPPPEPPPKTYVNMVKE